MSRPCPRPDKYPHPTKAKAKAAIGALWRDGKGNPDLNAYPCPGSKPTHWHVGHSRELLGKRIHRILAGAGRGRRSRSNRR